MLRQGHEEHRASRFLRLSVFGVADHTDNAERSSVGGNIDAEVLVDWIFFREKSSNECFVHDRDRSRLVRIGLRESAPAKDGLTDGLKVARADAIQRRS